MAPCCVWRVLGASYTFLFMAILALLLAQPVCSELPHFIQEPQDVIVKHKDEVTLRCDVTPKWSRIYWRYNKHLITSDPENGMEIRQDGLHIYVSRQRHKHSLLGFYQCVAVTDHGTVVSREASVYRAAIGSFASSTISGDLQLNATEGNVAVIECNPPRGTPPPNVVFEINNTITIDESAGRHHILPSGNLHIGNVKQSDQGTYRCIAVNPVSGQKRIAPHNVQLHVIAPWTNSPARIVKRPPLSTEVIRGHNLTLECVVEGAPVPVVTWQKYGGHLPDGRYTQVLGNLVIHNIESADEGTYICRAENDVGSPKFAVAAVDILEPPVIHIPPSSQMVAEGATVVLSCSARGHPKVKTEWLHNGEVVDASDLRISITDSVLTVGDVERGDAGVYQCVARSKLGAAYASSLLQVGREAHNDSFSLQDPPHQMQDIAPDSALSGNHEVTSGVMKSKPVATPLPVVSSTSPAQGEPHAGDRASSESPHEQDGNKKKKGRRRNRDRSKKNKDQGGQERSGDTIMVPPSKPRVSKLSDTSVMLEWTVPDNEGLPITFFKVQYKELSPDRRRRGWRTIDEDIPDTARQHEVRGLRPGGTYRFRVLAVYSNNDNKQGPNSARFTLKVEPAHRPKAPDSGPMIVNARPVSHDAISIMWQYLHEEPSPIEGFFIHYKPYGAAEDFAKQTVLGPNIRRHVVTGLLPNTQYSIKMESFNAAGASDPSNTVVKKTLAFKEAAGEGQSEAEENPDFTRRPSLPAALTTSSSVEVPEIPENRLSTQKSSELLYMVLGIVLGIMMLVLIIFMAMCGWKQHQQRRMMAAAMNVERNKFADPSRTMYSNSLHKEHNGTPFMLNGIGHKASNGHVPHAQQNGGSRVNISVNPLTEWDRADMESDSRESHSLQELRSSLQEVLQAPPPLPSNLYCDSTNHSRGIYPSLNCNSSSEKMPYPEHNSLRSLRSNHNPHNQNIYPGDQGIYEETEFYTPPHYGSLRRSPDQISQLSHDNTVNNLSTFRVAQDYVPRCQERGVGQPYDQSPNRSHVPEEQLCHYSPMREPSREEHIVPSKHHRRRRRRQHSSRDSPSQRDQATNTDLSSNEGTLEHPLPMEEPDPDLASVPPLPPCATTHAYSDYDCVPNYEDTEEEEEAGLRRHEDS